MARPKIGILGALVAVSGMLAWRWVQKHRASQTRLVQELSRWENEGGAVAVSTQAAPLLAPARRSRSALSGGAAPGAWRFPHG